MKNELLPTPKDLTLSQVMERFSTDETAREYLEAIRWPNGPVCPHCKNSAAKKIWKIRTNITKKIRAGLYRCAECDKEFTVTVGTIFEDSHIPLKKWLVAWYLTCSSKKGISALQIQRSLGLGSYRTAWMMMHKIRHSMKDPSFNEPLDGVLEADETYVGGKPHPFGDNRLEKLGFRTGSTKTPVVALVQRGGKIRTKVVPRVNQKNLKLFIGLNADPNSTVNTDQAKVYRPILRGFKRHDVVNHSQLEYARHNFDGTVSHVNNAESFFSLFSLGPIPRSLLRLCRSGE